MSDIPLLRVGPRDVVARLDPVALQEARSALIADGYVRLPGFLDAAAVDRARRELRATPLETVEHVGVGVEACFEPDVTLARLELQLNDRKVLTAAEALAGAHVGCFRGRIYQVVPNAGHHDAFHDDNTGGRVLALSVNLSVGPYRGGTLEIRAKGERDAVAVPNMTPGDALLFRIDPGLEHRITDMEGEEPKTALAGWFCTYPEFADRFRARMRRAAPTHDG